MKKKVSHRLYRYTTGFRCQGAGRWEKWRPTVSLTQHEDLVIDRLVLFYDRKYQSLLNLLTEDIAAVSPETEVVAGGNDIANPWDFGEVYAALFDFAGQYLFDTSVRITGFTSPPERTSSRFACF